VLLVEVGQAAHRLLAAPGGVRFLAPAGEDLQVANPALDVVAGELMGAALRVEHHRHVRVVVFDALEDGLMVGAQRR